jgi:hypothetical protein
MKGSDEERRWNHELRERLDEMIELARHLVRHAGEMSEEQLRDSQLRVEWLAEEIWRAAVHGPLEGSRGPEDR